MPEMSFRGRQSWRKGRGRGGYSHSRPPPTNIEALPICKCGQRCLPFQSRSHKNHRYFACCKNSNDRSRCNFTIWEEEFKKNPNLANVKCNREFFFLQNFGHNQYLKRNLDTFFSRLLSTKKEGGNVNELKYNVGINVFRGVYEDRRLSDDDIYLKLRRLCYPYEGKESTQEIEDKRAPNNMIDSQEKRSSYRIRDIIKMLPNDFKCSSLLDYGCGDGATTKFLGKELGLPIDKVFGADVIPPHNVGNPELKKKKKKKKSPSKTKIVEEEEEEDELILPKVNNSQELGFSYIFVDPNQPCRLEGIEDGSIDLLISLMALHHVKKLESTLNELYRVLNKEKGILIIREHDCDHQDVSVFLDIVHGSYAKVFSQPMENPKWNENYFARYRPINGWKKVLGDHRFRTMECSDRSFGIFKSFWASFIPDDPKHLYYSRKRERERFQPSGGRSHEPYEKKRKLD